MIGKTNCSEISTWPFTETVWGATRNPWDAEYSPGGSSGGSGAAVAAGLCGLGLGSDGLGSIRVPAPFCGNLVGFPASAIPAGFDDHGLPVAVQLAGPANSEHTLLSLAGQIERARPWPFPAGR